MHALFVLLWLGRLPCLPSETIPPLAEPETLAPAPQAPEPETPAPVALPNETATYRVTYGILGQVAEATVSFAPAAGSATPLVRAVGTGAGAVLGFGKMSKRIESEFDARALGPTRWTSTRWSDGKTTIDIAEQVQPGAVSLVRKRQGQPDQAAAFSRGAIVLDPLGLLLRIRLAVPTARTVYEVLDGRGLWLITLAPAAGPGVQPLLRLDGQADPVYWDGLPDKKRTARRFSLYLSNDARRIPVRLVVPFGIGEVRVDIVALTRPAAGPS